MRMQTFGISQAFVVWWQQKDGEGTKSFAIMAPDKDRTELEIYCMQL